jgi:hypothetical protein
MSFQNQRYKCSSTFLRKKKTKRKKGTFVIWRSPKGASLNMISLKKKSNHIFEKTDNETESKPMKIRCFPNYNGCNFKLY